MCFLCRQETLAAVKSLPATAYPYLLYATRFLIRSRNKELYHIILSSGLVLDHLRTYSDEGCSHCLFDPRS
jgi:hypothetical protein